MEIVKGGASGSKSSLKWVKAKLRLRELLFKFFENKVFIELKSSG